MDEFRPRMLLEPDVTKVAAMDESRSSMLPGTRRYQGGSARGMSIVDASRNPTLLKWQRWESGVVAAMWYPPHRCTTTPRL